MEENRTKRRRLYENNAEKYRTEKRRQYESDLKNNRAKKRMRYEMDSVRQRTQQRIRYAIASQNEQIRQKKLKRKCRNNRQYYEKKKEERKKENKGIDIVNKCNVAKKIIKKYNNFRCQSSKTLKLQNSLTIIKKNIVNKLNIKGQIEKELKADKIIRWCMHVTNGYIHKMYNMLATLKKKSEVLLTLVDKCYKVDEKLDALCRISRHTASSENYFIESIYHKVTFKESLIINMEGQVVNVLPLITAQAKKSWTCSTLCKTDNPVLIERYQKFLQTVSTCTVQNIPTLIESIHTYIVKTSNMKLGHAQSCYTNFVLCKAMFLPILLLSFHFPKVRNMMRSIYRLINFYKKMLSL